MQVQRGNRLSVLVAVASAGDRSAAEANGHARIHARWAHPRTAVTGDCVPIVTFLMTLHYAITAYLGPERPRLGYCMEHSECYEHTHDAP